MQTIRVSSAAAPLQHYSQSLDNIRRAAEQTRPPDSDINYHPYGLNMVREGGIVKRIPRPRNAFMIFASEHRRRFHQMHPDVANGEISVKLGDAWHQLPSEVKKHYFDRAKDEEKEHRRKYPFYQYRPAMSARRRRQAAISRDVYSQPQTSAEMTVNRPAVSTPSQSYQRILPLAYKVTQLVTRPVQVMATEALVGGSERPRSHLHSVQSGQSTTIQVPEPWRQQIEPTDNLSSVPEMLRISNSVTGDLETNIYRNAAYKLMSQQEILSAGQDPNVWFEMKGMDPIPPITVQPIRYLNQVSLAPDGAESSPMYRNPSYQYNERLQATLRDEQPTFTPRQNAVVTQPLQRATDVYSRVFSTNLPSQHQDLVFSSEPKAKGLDLPLEVLTGVSGKMCTTKAIYQNGRVLLVEVPQADRHLIRSSLSVGVERKCSGKAQFPGEAPLEHSINHESFPPLVSECAPNQSYRQQHLTNQTALSVSHVANNIPAAIPLSHATRNPRPVLPSQPPLSAIDNWMFTHGARLNQNERQPQAHSQMISDQIPTPSLSKMVRMATTARTIVCQPELVTAPMPSPSFLDPIQKATAGSDTTTREDSVYHSNVDGLQTLALVSASILGSGMPALNPADDEGYQLPAEASTISRLVSAAATQTDESDSQNSENDMKWEISKETNGHMLYRNVLDGAQPGVETQTFDERLRQIATKDSTEKTTLPKEEETSIGQCISAAVETVLEGHDSQGSGIQEAMIVDLSNESKETESKPLILSEPSSKEPSPGFPGQPSEPMANLGTSTLLTRVYSQPLTSPTSEPPLSTYGYHGPLSSSCWRRNPTARTYPGNPHPLRTDLESHSRCYHKSPAPAWQSPVNFTEVPIPELPLPVSSTRSSYADGQQHIGGALPGPIGGKEHTSASQHKSAFTPVERRQWNPALSTTETPSLDLEPRSSWDHHPRLSEVYLNRTSVKTPEELLFFTYQSNETSPRGTPVSERNSSCSLDNINEGSLTPFSEASHWFPKELEEEHSETTSKSQSRATMLADMGNTFFSQSDFNCSIEQDGKDTLNTDDVLGSSQCSKSTEVESELHSDTSQDSDTTTAESRNS